MEWGWQEQYWLLKLLHLMSLWNRSIVWTDLYCLSRIAGVLDKYDH